MKKAFASRILTLGLCTTFLAVVAYFSTNKELGFLNINAAIAGNNANVEEFISRGTEPFWSVTVTQGGIVYSSPDTRKLTFPYVAPLTAAGRPTDLVRVYRLTGKGNNMLMIKKVDNCSDGMSDNNYPYSATLILGDRVLEGCAERK
ncbi:hypothetical protein QUB80_10945 [Chlorogloeopsis sp. ULAP01]|uniref:COG3650 family protein n=1 Tax=Chlorogloeopsis sp. ULAP01 TaxID=3056483 RepID=UPI0025AA4F9A|nr:hypothetical protein [Chlorogloeopsis sp. ULAP01]MDM9381220.1 hypothetical protein [Chlorogloeopsis sp. ULAP01]